MFSILSVPGNNHHLPVCCGCTSALHAVPATGRSSYSQTWHIYSATAQWGRLWGNYSNTVLFVFSWMWSPWIYFLNFTCVRACLCVSLFVFRRCVHKWTAARPEETQSWSGLREHSSAGKSRSRNSARLFLTATRCLVKLYRWTLIRIRVGNFFWLISLALSPAALSLTSLSSLCT